MPCHRSFPECETVYHVAMLRKQQPGHLLGNGED